MLYNPSVVDPNRVATAADLQTTHPIGMTLDKFMDFFADVKSIEVNGAGIIDETVSKTFLATNIIEALAALAAVADSATNAVFVGTSRRRILPVGTLNADGTELRQSQRPTTLVDYPVHSAGGGGGGFIEINFGKSLTFAGLFYPYINIQFSNGMGNTAGGIPVGSIIFDGYGEILIYGGPDVDGVLKQGLAAGRISIKERYSDLRATSLQVNAGGQLVFQPSKQMRFLDTYKTAFFGATEAQVNASVSSLTVQVPLNAKSGPVRLLSTGPQFDSFLSYDNITIASSA